MGWDGRQPTVDFEYAIVCVIGELPYVLSTRCVEMKPGTARKGRLSGCWPGYLTDVVLYCVFHLDITKLHLFASAAHMLIPIWHLKTLRVAITVSTVRVI
jgi:hypothetical protein